MSERSELERHGADRSGLEVRSLTVRFGGLTALDDLNLVAARGRITGLIGPNGAGKTTLFNACTGWVTPTAGAVVLDGSDITGCSPSERARRGLARTFQQMELFEDLTVAENVALGREAAMAGRNPLTQLLSTRDERRQVAAATEEALALCDLEADAGRAVWSLSTGRRRLVELARVVSGGFDLMMMDEPSSGLDGRETEQVAAVLEALMQRRDMGIVLVEHDMSLVMRICAYVYVLDFGQLIFAGTPEQLQDSEDVRTAYLGTEVGG